MPSTQPAHVPLTDFASKVARPRRSRGFFSRSDRSVFFPDGRLYQYACQRAVRLSALAWARAEVPKRRLCNSFNSKGHELVTDLRSLHRIDEVEQNMTMSFGSRLQKLRCRLTRSAAIWHYGTPNEVRRTESVTSIATSVDIFMRRLTRVTRYVSPCVLFACVFSLGSPCAAQEVNVPNGRGSGSVVAPSGWVELITPVQQRVDLKFYGFSIGELNAPSAQVDATIRES